MSLKSHYLTVVETKTHKSVLNKVFFKAPDMNKFIKDNEILEKYPKPEFYIVKEYY